MNLTNRSYELERKFSFIINPYIPTLNEFRKKPTCLGKEKKV